MSIILTQDFDGREIDFEFEVDNPIVWIVSDDFDEKKENLITSMTGRTPEYINVQKSLSKKHLWGRKIRFILKNADFTPRELVEIGRLALDEFQDMDMYLELDNHADYYNNLYGDDTFSEAMRLGRILFDPERFKGLSKSPSRRKKKPLKSELDDISNLLALDQEMEMSDLIEEAAEDVKAAFVDDTESKQAYHYGRAAYNWVMRSVDLYLGKEYKVSPRVIGDIINDVAYAQGGVVAGRTYIGSQKKMYNHLVRYLEETRG